MLKLITSHRQLVERKSRELFLARSIPKPTEEELDQGIAIFINQLVEALGSGEGVMPEREIQRLAAEYGARLFELGFTVAELVNGYGAVCEAIMELGQERRVTFTLHDFDVLNRILDIAIAGAVVEYQRQQSGMMAHQEAEHVGALAHELRNALSAAALAFDAIQKGVVAAGGRTAEVLEHSLKRMADLLDQALAGVRLKMGSAPVPERLRLAEVLDHIAAMIQREAEDRGQQLQIAVDGELELETDRQLLLSALSNLVHNGVKYNRPSGSVWVKVQAAGDRVVVDVEDECGGLPPGKIDELFTPFVRRSSQRPGIGLGLSIVKRAVEKLGGEIRVRDMPGKGCVFTVEVPRVLSAGRPAPEHAGGLSG